MQFRPGAPLLPRLRPQPLAGNGEPAAGSAPAAHQLADLVRIETGHPDRTAEHDPARDDVVALGQLAQVYSKTMSSCAPILDRQLPVAVRGRISTRESSHRPAARGQPDPAQPGDHRSPGIGALLAPAGPR